ncbi:MAG: T9SS type A sorting domain-containing protein [bacterium]|nr:T9SS type A sorting domain-containing protein [bacterium]
MRKLDFLKIVGAIFVFGLLFTGVPIQADSLTTPIRIATSTANSGPTLGIPRWKGYMSETDPNRFYAVYGNGSNRLGNISYTSNGGTTWGTNLIQVDPLGYLDMHTSVFGRGGNMYVTWPGRTTIMFRKFNAPINSNTDRGPLVTIANTTDAYRSNIMVQNTGRIWLFTRLGGSPNENVRYNYSDNDGASWTRGTAFATQHDDVRIGSMPYVGGNPALVVLYLDDPRGFQYYLWNGSSFVARPDHAIYPVNMGHVRSFTHNVINDTTMHLIFGLGTQLHHVWKNYANGSGAWNHQTIDNSSTTTDEEWYPISTVRGGELFVFYIKKTSSSDASGMVYYKKWNQSSRTWTAPVLVSTNTANQSNRDPNTTFHVPANSPYIPVYWRTGTGPFNIYFSKIVVGTSSPTQYTLTMSRTPTAGGTILPTSGTSQHSAGSVVNISATPASGYAFSSWTGGVTNPTALSTTVLMNSNKSVVANFVASPTPVITCPSGTVNLTSCFPATLQISLPISNQTQVTVPGASWSANQLSFAADTSGLYSYRVTATNANGSTVCQVSIRVTIGAATDFYLTDDDISVSNPGAVPGNTVTLSAVIHSDPRSRPATNLVVRFYNGDPLLGGARIGSDQTIASINGGQSRTVSVQYVLQAPVPRTIFVVIDPNVVKPECSKSNNIGELTIVGSPVTAWIHGSVSAGSNAMHGVTVNLFTDEGDLFQSATTDLFGDYYLDEIPNGGYVVEVNLPLGYGSVSPAAVPVALSGDGVVVNFELSDATNGAIADFWWWKRQIVAMRDGAPVESDMTRADIDQLGATIYEHFYARTDGFAIRIDGATNAGGTTRALTFLDIASLWIDDPSISIADRTRMHLLACLLNVASSRLSLRRVVTSDGATASQAITFIANRFMAGDTTDVTLWSNLSRINARTLIASGVIPLSTANIMYKPENNEDGETLPNGYSLSQNYPNPFNPTTTIEYALAAQATVQIHIYNVAGQRVRTLVDKDQSAGVHRIIWDGTDDNGNPVGSGIYFSRLTADNHTYTRKMTLLK